MKKTAFSRWIKPFLILSLACSFAFTATAQNYYPADIGNMWILESIDGTARSTYTLEGPEIINGEEYILLQIRTEELETGEVDTDKYFLTVGSDAITLHRTVLEFALPPATLSADLPTPVTFFPLQLVMGDQWQITVNGEAKLEIGLTLSVNSVTNFEVVGFEDVVTPSGTFQNCAKVRLDLLVAADTAFLDLEIESTTHQWFAPDVGPVQYENSDGLLFSLTSSNLLTTPEEPNVTEEDTTSETLPEESDVTEESEPTPEEDTTTAEDTMTEPTPEEEAVPEPVPYDVTGDGIVNILDLTFVASRFGEADADADVTGDGTVNILDLVLISQNLSK